MNSVSANEERNRAMGASFILGVAVGLITAVVFWLAVKVCRVAALPSDEPGAPAIVIWQVDG